jgi:hypothetical protein
MARKKPTRAEIEKHKAFRAQMQANIDRMRELAMRIRLDREAREREQPAS